MKKAAVLLPFFSMMLLSSLAQDGGTRDIKAGEDDRTSYGGRVDSELYV
ncbi:MAG: hypothetical protein H7222_05270 [Methylotenera sp.]|nr:hypothetical protein [Oligoflexia bacterium]